MLSDISFFLQSNLNIGVLFFAALLIGMSKTGIQGVTMLSVPLLALTFGAKPSTGLILPMLCFSDFVAVIYYRRAAQWKYIWRLIPPAIIGFFIAIAVDSYISADGFRTLMGLCLLIGLVLMLWSEYKGINPKWSDKSSFSAAFGLLGGFTTMIGNAAGPVMSIYLLSKKLPKLSFVGTTAWFFLIINLLKLPLQYFVWDNISSETLLLNLYTVPFMLLGAVLGVLFVKKISENNYRKFVIAVTIISTLLLLL